MRWIVVYDGSTKGVDENWEVRVRGTSSNRNGDSGVYVGGEEVLEAKKEKIVGDKRKGEE